MRVTRPYGKTYCVYIMANVARTLYVGVTSNLEVRVWQHKEKVYQGFTSKYGLDQLVYYEEYPEVAAAIAREKQLKGWLRAKKVALVGGMNPGWVDLSDGWYG